MADITTTPNQPSKNHAADGQRARRDAGASLVEYALLVALIALVCVVAVTFMGGQTSTSFSEFGSHVEAS